MTIFAWATREAVRLTPWAIIYVLLVWKVKS